MFLIMDKASGQRNYMYSAKIPIREQPTCSLKDYFKKDGIHGGTVISVNKIVDRTAAAFSISKYMVVTIRKENF